MIPFIAQTNSSIMTVHHEESKTVYDITEHESNYKLVDSSTNRTYFFKESYEAVWFVIELIRNSSFDKLSEDDLKEITKRSHLDLPVIPKSLIAMLKREKISRTYYDQIFLKLLSQYRAGVDSITVSNKTNFIVNHEVGHLVRNITGAKPSFPSVKI